MEIKAPPGEKQPRKPGTSPRLDRVLGRRDLVLLFVVAVANLNIVPAIAAAGPMTVWLWLLAFLLYFWPQGVAVTELSHQWPGEGGIYLWTKYSFGERHGFLAGWCYWLANVVYLPTLLLSCLGVGVYIFGGSTLGLADNGPFTAAAACALLLFLLAVNVRGLSAGKWLNDIGGIGTIGGGLVVCFLGALTLRGHGSALHISDLKPNLTQLQLLGAFGTICYSLQGLDLASIMGDEIREPRKILPSAILWGGILCGLIYLGVTVSMLVALPPQQIGMLSGLLQAANSMAQRTGLQSLVVPLALLTFIAILGSASAWFTGAARLPFVAGIDRYLPASLGKVHPRYHTPYVALSLFALCSCFLICASYLGATVGEAYVTLLELAVILQMVPNVYMFAVLLKYALHSDSSLFASRSYVIANAACGLVSSLVAVCVAFIPEARTRTIWLYELKLILACLIVLGSAFYFYSRSRAPGSALGAEHRAED